MYIIRDEETIETLETVDYEGSGAFTDELVQMFKNLEESKDELVNKVSWPTLSEVTSSAVVVLVASLLIAGVVWVMDFCFDKAMSFIYNLL
jgi:preprotein translocase subunit SecE